MTWSLTPAFGFPAISILTFIRSDDARLDGLDIVLKGGQMGPVSFLADVLDA